MQESNSRATLSGNATQNTGANEFLRRLVIRLQTTNGSIRAGTRFPVRGTSAVLSLRDVNGRWTAVSGTVVVQNVSANRRSYTLRLENVRFEPVADGAIGRFTLTGTVAFFNAALN